jgi:hypothetical protein
LKGNTSKMIWCRKMIIYIMTEWMWSKIDSLKKLFYTTLNKVLDYITLVQAKTPRLYGVNGLHTFICERMLWIWEEFDSRRGSEGHFTHTTKNCNHVIVRALNFIQRLYHWQGLPEFALGHPFGGGSNANSSGSKTLFIVWHVGIHVDFTSMVVYMCP